MYPWLMTAWLAIHGGGAPPRSAASGLTPVSTAVQSSDRLEIGGLIAMTADALPKEGAAEVRPLAGLAVTARPSRALRLRFEGFAEALAADRGEPVTDAAVRVREAWFEIIGGHVDVRAGYGRLSWGRLDEVQPSDVINPLDTSRFLLEGRSAARLPVSFVRARAFSSERLVVEGLIVPAFRRGSFDELDESTSPFNLVNDVVLPATLAATSRAVEHVEPEASWGNVSGGGRVSATVGRVDVTAGVFRGFDGFGLVTFEPTVGQVVGQGPSTAVVGRLVERYPRFTMLSGDFETVVREWAIRGEAAVFVDKQFLGVRRPGSVGGRALDAGLGFDRRTGEFRVFGSVLVHRQWSNEDPDIDRTDVSLVGSVERQFSRDRYLVRAFAVVNPGDASAFARGLFTWSLRDNVAIEGSAAMFLGTGDDTLSRFTGRDFVLARVRYRW